MCLTPVAIRNENFVRSGQEKLEAWNLDKRYTYHVDGRVDGLLCTLRWSNGVPNKLQADTLPPYSEARKYRAEEADHRTARISMFWKRANDGKRQRVPVWPLHKPGHHAAPLRLVRLVTPSLRPQACGL
jgi:hypothetical protein